MKAVPGDALAQLALDQMAALQNRTTLAEWKAEHTTDAVTPYHTRPTDPFNENWCARAMDLVIVDADKSMRRAAYFYRPAVPDSAAVPDGAPEKLLDECRLGLVWVETADSDGQRTDAVAAEANSAFTASIGPGDSATKLNFTSSRHAARWQMSDVIVALGTTTSIPRDQSGLEARLEPKPDAPPAPKPERVLVGIAGPASGITFTGVQPEAEGTEPSDELRAQTAQRVDEALRISARDAALDGQMRTYLKTFQSAAAGEAVPAPTAADRAAFVSTLETWMDMPANFPAMRRVATLVAADLVLHESAGWAGWQDRKQTALRRRLQTIGATFEDSPPGNVFLYTHSWLKKADRTNAGGRPAELAFLSLATMGFETSGTCSDVGANGFLEVIRRGEERLRTHPNSSIATDLHFLIAKAYSDIVRLADGGGDNFADADDFKKDAERARKRALEEFRLAFAAEPSSPRAKALWPTAWRLAAGLSATRTFFFCVYD
jgi:hypothetical protein